MKKNPLKRAIAVKYDQIKSHAPKVVAKGAGSIAEQIIEKARSNEVQILEDDALTQLLYQLEVNEQIPHELYPIVAEVYAFLYQAEQAAEKLNHE